jgi:GR25 family glycosyltransferase involved in LPS biosynthesis
MSFINRVCDKVFVINLEKDKDRLQTFDEQMKKNHISYDRFDAILGSKVLRDERLSEYCNTFCTDAMKGCALSHRSIWEIMIEKGYENIIIFEDDIIVPETFDRDFSNVWNFLPKDYDIVYLGYPFGMNEEDNIAHQLYTKIHGHVPEELNEYTLKIRGSVGAYGYMLSLKGAKHFCEKPIQFHVDAQIMYWIREYNYTSYAITPQLVNTTVETSNISDTYPILLNSALKQVKINDTIDLKWVMNENFMKLGIFNISPLLCVILLILLFVPTWVFVIVYLWLLIELLASFDLKNTFRYSFFISLIYLFKCYK